MTVLVVGGSAGGPSDSERAGHWVSVSEKDTQSVFVFMANKCAGKCSCLLVVCCRSVNDVTCFTFVNVSCSTVRYFVTRIASGFCIVFNLEGLKIILKFVPLNFVSHMSFMNTQHVLYEWRLYFTYISRVYMVKLIRGRSWRIEGAVWTRDTDRHGKIM